MVWDFTHYTDHPPSTVPNQLECAHCFCMAGTNGIYYCHRCGKRQIEVFSIFKILKMRNKEAI
mgnify:CR=1 FL=1